MGLPEIEYYGWIDEWPEVKKMLNVIIDLGPRRIMTSPDVAVLPRRSPHYKWKFIFVREDGWNLGTNEEHLYWAYRTWASEWKYALVKEITGAITCLTIEKWREYFMEGDL